LLASWGLGNAFDAYLDHDAGRRRPNRLIMGAEGLTAGFQRSWSGPLPRLGLFGEFSAGKSSIVNLLLGHEVLPTAVLSSTRRPTYVRHAADLRIEAITADGTREPVSPDAVKTLAREDISHFDIGMPNELLRHVELLDTPGFADPYHRPERTLGVVESVDICIWCTLATQAWRQSERQTWLSLQARSRTNGILVVTHIDTLAHRREHQRVRTRLEREAGDLFGDIVLLAVPDAMRARRADGLIADPELWRDSGGKALISALQRAVIDCGRTRRDRTDIKTAPRTRSGLAPTGRAIPVAATRVTATPVATPAVAPRAMGTAASETSAVPLDPVAAAELQSFLAKVMETVPACLAAGWIDLAGRRVLQLRGIEADLVVGSASLGEAITELFQGDNVRRIEGLFKRTRGLIEDDRHYFREIVIAADGCVGILLRGPSRADRALVVVSDTAVTLGMALAKARGLMASTDHLM
jgi:Dynamin family